MLGCCQQQQLYADGWRSRWVDHLFDDHSKVNSVDSSVNLTAVAGESAKALLFDTYSDTSELLQFSGRRTTLFLSSLKSSGVFPYSFKLYFEMMDGETRMTVQMSICCRHSGWMMSVTRRKLQSNLRHFVGGILVDLAGWLNQITFGCHLRTMSDDVHISISQRWHPVGHQPKITGVAHTEQLLSALVCVPFRNNID